MAIYKFYRLRWTRDWYQLSAQERRSLLDRVGAARDQVGAHHIIGCESGWASESWQYAGVEEFPNLDCVQAHHRLLEELDWFRYVESESTLGTCAENRIGVE